MTAGAFAELLQARPSGAGRWQARCPAHTDSSPSLSIREGREGRVLLRCFAGCSLTDILAKLNLSIRDLFSGPPPTREQLAKLQAEQDVRERAGIEQRRWLIEPCERERKCQAVADALMGKLVRAPEDEAQPLAKLYHSALDRVREWRAEAKRREAHAQTERDGAKG